MATPVSTSSAQELLFTIDLGLNGGVFAPRDDIELLEWVEKETSYSSWMTSIPQNNFSRARVIRAHQELKTLGAKVERLPRDRVISKNLEVEHHIGSIKNAIENTFVTEHWPHSSTPIAKRAAELAAEDPLIAAAYLFVVLYATADADLEGWDLGSTRGYLIGLTEKFGLDLLGDGGLAANKAAFDELRAAMEKFLREREAVFKEFQALHSEAVGLHFHETKRQKKDFDEKIESWEKAHADLTQKHTAEMDAMKKTFREGMALRGPVEYWTKKASDHKDKAGSLLWVVFGTLVGATVAVAVAAVWALQGIGPDTKPDAAKLAILILVGVMGIWGLRLVVRMWLSHTHLATDASERVTMVQTYLAILEEDKMPSDEDRKLVLAPLFRPAADGLVKDEGLPHPMLDFLTRSKS